ncbi:MAG: NAD(P)/FAD-dependent oxidoreductase [Sulfuricaulis sp.]
MAKPHVLVLGGNFAGLGAAQKIREYATERVTITVVDRKPHLLYIPNIGSEVLANCDPGVSMQMPIIEVLRKDDIDFMLAEVESLDVKAQTVTVLPSERPGSTRKTLRYDYLVVALGARLAYDKIEGFAQYGHTVSDCYYGNALRKYLHGGGYRGGPVAVGSARFIQGRKERPTWLPDTVAACEGPPVETALSLAAWMTDHDFKGASNITLFTPAEMIAEDAGKNNVTALLKAASRMGFKYRNKLQDIRRLTANEIEFVNGETIEAELKIVFPNWEPHAFLQGLPISDEVGFVLTDMRMRNPDFPNVFACGDCAAITVPKLGSIGHQECEMVGKQIAKELGVMSAEHADTVWLPEVLCIGDMGHQQAFYIHANSWFGGDVEVLKMGRVPYMLKQSYKEMFFRSGGKIPAWSVPLAGWAAERIAI